MEDLAVIEKQTLSDGSVTYNVLLTVGELWIRFGCVDAAGALLLMRNLNEAVWIQIQHPTIDTRN